MKPVIGICANYFNGLDELYGGLGGKLDWQLVPDDYISSVEKAGGIPLIIPIYNDEDNIYNIINDIDGLILTGGNDIFPEYYGQFTSTKIGAINPRRDKHELTLVKNIIDKSNIPVLGICRGNQLLNVAYGGTLYQDFSEIPLKLRNNIDINHSMREIEKYIPVHQVFVDKKSKIFSIFKEEEIRVNSYHHQVIKDPAHVFEVSGRSPDGIIESIEMRGNRFVVGVQWHPEMMWEHYEKQFSIFKFFVNKCSKSISE